MEAQSITRKLAAILSADVAGYSRLMSEDEVTTIRTLTAYRALMTALIEQHRGRVVDAPGDNLLAEFASVVDAVQSAVAIQRELKTKNAELPDHRKMEFRIGINLGDVVVEGERPYGDGVNIAARLESLADPGGICLSGTVYEHVENKLALNYEYLGEQAVKNITKPVRVYRVVLNEAAWVVVEQAQESHTPRLPARRRSRPWRLISAAILILAVGGVAGVWYWASTFLQRSSQSTPEEPALPLPDKPSLVVLPFVNLSGDPEQEYFSDGLTEDLTSDLSQIPNLFVIARNSAFTYKGQAVKVQDVGREMGVRYVLEGSVRRDNNRVRINAQLIDTTTGHHLWAERYDRPLHDLFAVQEEIRQKIVTTLHLQLRVWEQGATTSDVRKRTANLEAYDYFLRGVEYILHFTPEANAQARQMLEKAIALDPEYAQAYQELGWTYFIDWVWQWHPDPRNQEQAVELAQQALALDDSVPQAHHLLGALYSFRKQYDQAIAELERAIAIDPNFADGYWRMGEVLNFMGRPEEAVRVIKQAMRLNPRYPAYYTTHFRRSLFFGGAAGRGVGRAARGSPS